MDDKRYGDDCEACGGLDGDHMPGCSKATDGVPWSDLPAMALSVRQPWTYSILHLGKDVENRDWPTRFRGDVCLHASKGMTRDEYEDCLATVHEISLVSPWPRGTLFPAFESLERGGIVGVVEIVDCVSSSTSNWFFGKFGFVLRNPRPVELIPVKGALGFFEWRRNLTDAARAAAPDRQEQLL